MDRETIRRLFRAREDLLRAHMEIAGKRLARLETDYSDEELAIGAILNKLWFDVLLPLVPSEEERNRIIKQTENEYILKEEK